MFSEVKKIISSVDGWLSEREAQFLYQTAKEASKDGVIVEIGSWQGKSTICLAKGSQEGNKVPVYAIDPHIGSSEHQKDGQKVWTFERFKENIKVAGVEDMIFPIVKTSEDVVKEWDKPISFLWIDGAHEYEFVKKDFELWSPFLIDGGVVAFHDTTGSFPGVKIFLRENFFYNELFSDSYFTGSIFSKKKGIENNSIKNKLTIFLKNMYDFFYSKITSKRLRSLIKKLF